jgi:hypothetical protein
VGELSEARGDEAAPPGQSDLGLRQPPAALKKYTFVDYVFQFITITAGVLIALLINGLVEWNDNRELVEQARATVRREVEANLKELEGLPANIKRSAAELETAMRFAEDMLSKGQSDIRTLGLNFNLATLNASGWQTAERTGALAHMDYDEVQVYSELYGMQQLFDDQQRKAVDLVATSSTLLASSFDPTKANAQEISEFRRQIMLLQSNLLVTGQFGEQLAEGYREFLQKKSN